MILWSILSLVITRVFAAPYNSTFQGVVINGPADFIQCDLVRLTWQGGVPPYTIFLQRFDVDPPADLRERVESRSGNWNGTSLNLYLNLLGGSNTALSLPPRVVFGVLSKSDYKLFAFISYDVLGSQNLNCITNRNNYPNDTMAVNLYRSNSDTRPPVGDTAWLGNGDNAETSATQSTTAGTSDNPPVGTTQTGTQTSIQPSDSSLAANPGLSTGSTANAANSADSVGQSGPSGGGGSGSPNPAQTGPNGSVTTVQTVGNNVSSGLAPGTIAGIVVGIVIGIIGLLVAIFLMCCRQRYYSWKESRDHKGRVEKTQAAGALDLIDPYVMEVPAHDQYPSTGRSESAAETGSSTAVAPEVSATAGQVPPPPLTLLAPRSGARAKAREAAGSRVVRNPTLPPGADAGAFSVAESSNGQDGDDDGDSVTEPEVSRPLRLHEDGGRLERLNFDENAEDVPPVYNPHWREQ